MSSNSVTVRRAATDAPILMLVYGILRLVDGFDGHRGPGLAWNLGHVAFFAAMVLFGVLALALAESRGAESRSAGGRSAGSRKLAAIAAGATVFGVACFLWVIAGDLSAGFRESMPLPEPLQAAGPMAFTLGMLTLLGLQVAARRAPFWSPLLFGAAIAAITVNLDLLPLAALLLVAACAPLAKSNRQDRQIGNVQTARALH
ncbi:hypothetical protein AB0M02_25275 [Actinoplanes sp. NPDC051861]|uniref:hypothetical protein n=1 Tax=Actinoplanes sp. NPDC051861 TaxID=3155170 RepID=UPI0034270B9D